MPKKNIAIIGSGISGLSCAHYLQKKANVFLYEAEDYLGGHTATKTLLDLKKTYAVDTGFIVFNQVCYPNFCRLLDELGVESKPTDMSFSVQHNPKGLTYNGASFATLFAQKRNIFKPSFYYFLYQILVFNRHACHALAEKIPPEITLGDFLKQHRIDHGVIHQYLVPMAAAIWSSPLRDVLDFPLHFFLNFFKNHGLLSVSNRPQWFVVRHGSKTYVDAIMKQAAFTTFVHDPVQSIRREKNKIRVISKKQDRVYDDVILACHSDQALSLIEAPTDQEQAVLSKIPYQKNEVVLHKDKRLMPKEKKAWAAWNIHVAADKAKTAPVVTYWMNALQGLDASTDFFVSLNASQQIDPERILGRYVYAHPKFDVHTQQAQQARKEINGVDRLWFCGAYWYHGFHEDGIRSALDVVEALS